ncbi:uncharacterized protein Bfra_011856 [Botrytis fragariae]|uniref:Uncharacterized protein n=1 Tax=Botrytis fragariae TaxID=1964551 RepID=A0A8H6EE60_9HELO|nr:uncharacterized protein Bfra_011856 [Botrytis fragariae]KAF5868891.1 hypothetical protein Bfra_011856 [Botrytis fragariae]
MKKTEHNDISEGANDTDELESNGRQGSTSPARAVDEVSAIPRRSHEGVGKLGGRRHSRRQSCESRSTRLTILLHCFAISPLIAVDEMLVRVIHAMLEA